MGNFNHILLDIVLCCVSGEVGSGVEKVKAIFARINTRRNKDGLYFDYEIQKK